MKYINLKIVAKAKDVDIWLSDNQDNLVQKETGVMETSVLPGFYRIHYGKLKNNFKGFNLILDNDQQDVIIKQ